MPGDVDPYDEMPVHDEVVPEQQFAAFVERMPQVCVELVVESDDGLLLTKRAIEPRVWFWPGGRLHKGESLQAAAHRVAEEELGIEVRLRDRLGVHAHLWRSSAVEGSPSRHTVNVVYHATPASESFSVDLDEQHSAHRFVTTVGPDHHEYVREYVETHDLL